MCSAGGKPLNMFAMITGSRLCFLYICCSSSLQFNKVLKHVLNFKYVLKAIPIQNSEKL